jgi:hypothetical protein
MRFILFTEMEYVEFWNVDWCLSEPVKWVYTQNIYSYANGTTSPTGVYVIVRARGAGSALNIHQCNNQPYWYFCNFYPGIRARGAGSTLVMHQRSNQQHWQFCNIYPSV